MRVIIAGSRDIQDPTCVDRVIRASGFEITTVISGQCPTGVDKLGEEWAAAHQIPVELYPARWNEEGKAAGPLRNERMAKVADALIAIWDGESRGTKSMIELAGKYGLKVFIMRI